MQKMMSIALGPAGGGLQRSLGYGTLLASLGGVHGIRGSSLKRIQAAARADPKDPTTEYVESLDPFRQ